MCSVGCVVRLERDWMLCIQFRMRRIIMKEKKSRCTYSECSAFEPLNITIYIEPCTVKTYTLHFIQIEIHSLFRDIYSAIICTHNLTYYINGGRSTIFFLSSFFTEKNKYSWNVVVGSIGRHRRRSANSEIFYSFI